MLYVLRTVLESTITFDDEPRGIDSALFFVAAPRDFVVKIQKVKCLLTYIIGLETYRMIGTLFLLHKIP